MSDKKLSVFICTGCGKQIHRVTDGHYHPNGAGEMVDFVPAEEVEVIPVEAANVLSVEEAQLVRRMESAMGQFDQQEWQKAVALQDRLEDWASKEAP